MSTLMIQDMLAAPEWADILTDKPAKPPVR